MTKYKPCLKSLCICLCLIAVEGVVYPSNYADQRFLDNADQFTEEEGVQLFPKKESSYKSPNEYSDPNMVPIAAKKEEEAREPVKKKIGFSFSQMASSTQKKTAEESAKEKADEDIKKEKRVAQPIGFSFKTMADLVQKTDEVSDETITTEDNK